MSVEVMMVRKYFWFTFGDWRNRGKERTNNTKSNNNNNQLPWNIQGSGELREERRLNLGYVRRIIFEFFDK